MRHTRVRICNSKCAPLCSGPRRWALPESCHRGAVWRGRLSKALRGGSVTSHQFLQHSPIFLMKSFSFPSVLLKFLLLMSCIVSLSLGSRAYPRGRLCLPTRRVQRTDKHKVSTSGDAQYSHGVRHAPAPVQAALLVAAHAAAPSGSRHQPRLAAEGQKNVGSS